jgi:16S rRNA processing protein RimM
LKSSKRSYAAQRRNKPRKALPSAVARRAESPTKQTPPLTGSPNESEPDFILIGFVRRPHGLKGELLFSLETDFPEHLIKGAKFYLSEEHLTVTVRSRRNHAQGLLLTFEEFPDKPSVERLHNVPVYSKIAEMPALPEGKVYQHQLLGLQVVEENGESVGRLTQILSTGSNDVYVVRDEAGKEILLPAISDVVRRIDLDDKRVIVRIIPGLR